MVIVRPALWPATMLVAADQLNVTELPVSALPPPGDVIAASAYTFKVVLAGTARLNGVVSPGLRLSDAVS